MGKKNTGYCPNPKCKTPMEIDFTKAEINSKKFVVHQRFCPGCNCLVEFKTNGTAVILASANSPIPVSATAA